MELELLVMMVMTMDINQMVIGEARRQIFGKEGDDWKLESTLVGVRARGEGRLCHALYLSLFAPG